VKMFLSVKGVLLLTLLLVMALGSGTAMASRGASVAAQDSLERRDGATIVTSSLCTPNNSEFTVWGSGWGSGEIIILSVVKDSDTSQIWFSGSVNASGAFELKADMKTKLPNATSNTVKYPGDGLFTLEALGVSGRLATTPLLTVAEKCGA
jgi:hypothetical protein